MQATEKRIAALEQVTHSDDCVIYVTAVEPGKLNEPLIYVSDRDGNEWNRLPHETQETFKARVSSEVKRNEWGVAVLFNFPMGSEPSSSGGAASST